MEQKALNHNIAKIKQYHEMTKDGHVVFSTLWKFCGDCFIYEASPYEEKPTDSA